MNIKKYGALLLATGMLSLALTSVAFAADKNETGKMGPRPGMGMIMGMRRPGVVGKVTAVSGTTLTVTAEKKNQTAAATFTIDASAATVMKNGVTSSVSQIAVSDMIVVEGTVSGTSIKATLIRDGMKEKQEMMDELKDIQGNGQPVVAGQISAISGNSITVKNNNQTYTVDASSAKVVKAGVANATVSNVAVGDTVIIQGTVNGNAVVASTILDKPVKTENSSSQPSTNPALPRMRFFGGVGNFFKHLFGF
jgi:hypothetical protein